MKIVKYQHANDYLQKVEAFLLEDEAMNNLPLGVLTRLANNGEETKKEIHLFLVESDDQVKGIFMRTPPHLWIVAAKEQDRGQVVQEVVSYLKQEQLDVPGVIGTKETANQFAERWVSLTGKSAEVHMEQLIYKLTEINNLSVAEGELVQSQPGDEDLVADWLQQFAKEADEAILGEQANDMANRFVKQGSAHFWNVNGKNVSMANSSRATKNGITINGVFTPDEYKRMGYATSCVLKLSEKLLNQGYQFCSLYTDAANPTSNSIYKKIGYNHIGDSIVIHFK